MKENKDFVKINEFCLLKWLDSFFFDKIIIKVDVHVFVKQSLKKL